jgi:hypothetical protein
MKAKEKPQNVEPIVETPDKKDETTIQAAKINFKQTVIVAVIGALALFGNSYINKPSPIIEDTKIVDKTRIEIAKVNQAEIDKQFESQVQSAQQIYQEVGNDEIKSDLTKFVEVTQNNRLEHKNKSDEFIENLKTGNPIIAEKERKEANKIITKQNGQTFGIYLIHETMSDSCRELEKEDNVDKNALKSFCDPRFGGLLGKKVLTSQAEVKIAQRLYQLNSKSLQIDTFNLFKDKENKKVDDSKLAENTKPSESVEKTDNKLIKETESNDSKKVATNKITVE